MVSINISSYTADKITISKLEESIELNREIIEEIEEIEEREPLPEYKERDLCDCKNILWHLIEVYKYYTVKKYRMDLSWYDE